MDLFNPIAASFEQPAAMLRACHGKVRRFCGQLDQLPSYLKQHGFNTPAAQAVAQIRHYFNSAAPLHHQDEEEDFFPLLQRYAPETAATVAELAAEHPRLHRLWADLDAHLAALADTAQADAALIQAFTTAYTQHMPAEETLFDLGERVIPAPEMQRIGRNMAARRQG